MHIPNALYERAPHYWLLVGMLLIILGIYLGLEVSSSFLFSGVTLGLASCAWGIRVMMRRSRRPGEVNVTGPGVSADQEA